MRITYSHSIPAGREAAFDTFLSSDALESCIPGCEQFEDDIDGAYSVTMTVGAGAVKGTYKAVVSLSEVDRPNSIRMMVAGKGKAGTMKGEGVVRFTEEGGVTTVVVDGSVQVSGVVARVGQRLLSGVANSLLGRFFECMAKKAQTA